MPAARLTVPCPARVIVEMDGEQIAPRTAIRRARKDKGLSMQGLSVSCGHNQDTVRKWEMGLQDARAENWIRLLIACGYKVVIERIEA